MSRNLLKPWLVEALKYEGGVGNHLKVAKYIWDHHEEELRAAGDLFYKWQYELRWAAQTLKRESKLALEGGKWRLL